MLLGQCFFSPLRLVDICSASFSYSPCIKQESLCHLQIYIPTLEKRIVVPKAWAIIWLILLGLLLWQDRWCYSQWPVWDLYFLPWVGEGRELKVPIGSQSMGRITQKYYKKGGNMVNREKLFFPEIITFILTNIY